MMLRADTISRRTRVSLFAGALALVCGATPTITLAQTANPWREQGAEAPVYAPVEPAQLQPPSAAVGSYAPANLDQTLSSGSSQPSAPSAVTTPEPEDRRLETYGTTSNAVPPVSGVVVPPYAGLPLAGGYGYVPVPPVQPNTTILVPNSGYSSLYGYPGGGYGYPGYGYGYPNWGNGWNGNNTWNGWNPNGFGFPMGGFSPFGFW